MKKNKRTVLQVIMCIGVICLIWSGYFLVTHYGTGRILEVRDDNFSWVYQVDSINEEDEDIVLRGFAFELDKDSKEGAFEIVLQDIDTGKRYFPMMKYVERKDVNDYFLCKYNYLQSGFEAIIKAKRIDLEERSYEILLRMGGERLTYRTGTYISKGMIVYVNPSEFEALDVVATDLQEVVEKGILRVYRPDYGMYVYQYEGELYWIAEVDYGFNEQGDVTVEYQLDTTQVDKLPQLRLEKGWDWDNLGFSFLGHELKEINTGKYRVAKMRLPIEYAVSKIWTGNYDDGWIWRQYFRPYYVFK